MAPDPHRFDPRLAASEPDKPIEDQGVDDIGFNEEGGVDTGWGDLTYYIENPADADERAKHQASADRFQALDRRETAILKAMAKASLPEQQRLLGELSGLRNERSALRQAARDIDLANAVVHERLTPVTPLASKSTGASDWLAEVVVGSGGNLHHAMVAEAAIFWGSTHPAVKADVPELVTQALGKAQHIASAYGPRADLAAQTFMDEIVRLAQAEPAGEPSDDGAAGSSLPDSIDPTDAPEGIMDAIVDPGVADSQMVESSRRSRKTSARRQAALDDFASRHLTEWMNQAVWEEDRDAFRAWVEALDDEDLDYYYNHGWPAAFAAWDRSREASRKTAADATPMLIRLSDDTEVRPATREEWERSTQAVADGDWSGAIEVDGEWYWVSGDSFPTTARRVTAASYMEVGPAYGRDYKSLKEAKADWDADKDFVVLDWGPHEGKYLNKSQATSAFPGTVFMVRYKAMTQTGELGRVAAVRKAARQKWMYANDPRKPGWVINPIDTDGRHWARIDDTGLKNVLTIYELARDAETTSDVLVRTEDFLRLEDAKAWAEAYFDKTARHKAAKDYVPCGAVSTSSSQIGMGGAPLATCTRNKGHEGQHWTPILDSDDNAIMIRWSGRRKTAAQVTSDEWEQIYAELEEFERTYPEPDDWERIYAELEEFERTYPDVNQREAKRRTATQQGWKTPRRPIEWNSSQRQIEWLDPSLGETNVTHTVKEWRAEVGDTKLRVVEYPEGEFEYTVAILGGGNTQGFARSLEEAKKKAEDTFWDDYEFYERDQMAANGSRRSRRTADLASGDRWRVSLPQADSPAYFPNLGAAQQFFDALPGSGAVLEFDEFVDGEWVVVKSQSLQMAARRVARRRTAEAQPAGEPAEDGAAGSSLPTDIEPSEAPESISEALTSGTARPHKNFADYVGNAKKLASFRERVAARKTAIKGAFRIVDSVGSFSGEPFFTLQYMGAEDSPGYGVWEDVTSSSDRSELEAFITNPPEWWGTTASRKTAMPSPADLGVKVGDFFYSSWGYDQTNVSFFEVKALTNAGVKVQRCDSTVARSSTTDDYVVPIPGTVHRFDEDGPVTKILKNGWNGQASIAVGYGRSKGNDTTAYLWDGQPKRQTGAMYGH